VSRPDRAAWSRNLALLRVPPDEFCHGSGGDGELHLTKSLHVLVLAVWWRFYNPVFVSMLGFPVKDSGEEIG